MEVTRYNKNVSGRAIFLRLLGSWLVMVINLQEPRKDRKDVEIQDDRMVLLHHISYFQVFNMLASFWGATICLVTKQGQFPEIPHE